MDELFDAMSALEGTARDAGNYEDRKVGRTEVGGLIVSTCFTFDCGYETAILDTVGAYPVERYSSRKEAEEGHVRWVKEAETAAKVVELGYGTSIPPKEITLSRGIKD